jgi:hypothetical protein
MKSARASFISLTCVLLVACHRQLSENERKLVGTWDRTGMDTNERITYRADHTMESTMSDGSSTEPFAKGTWRLEGNILIEEFTVPWQPVAGETPFPKQVIRDPIVAFQPEKIVREKGRPPLIRVK